MGDDRATVPGYRFAVLAMCAVSPFPAPAVAAAGAWHFNFQQGIAEYAVGSFAAGGSNLALYCAEGGVGAGSASVTLHRAGFAPASAAPAVFATEKGRVSLDLDREGSARFDRPAAAPGFRALWRLLATSRSLTVRYGPGRPMRLSLAGAAGLLGPTVCPKQLAG